MILKLHKDQGRLSLQDGTEKLTIQEQGTEGDYFVYEASNDLPASDLLNLVNQGVLFENYPFKVKLLASELDNTIPLEGYETIRDIPTPHEYSNDESEVLIGAIMKTQGDSGRYLNQEEMQLFRDAGYTLFGKRDIAELKANDVNWQKEEEKLL